MKKQFVAKLLVLVMVLALVPMAALAADMGVIANGGVSTVAANDSLYNNPYNVPVEDSPTVPATPDTPTAKPSEPTVSEEKPEVVETIDDVKSETNAEGETVVTATIEVKDATAPAEVSEKAVDALINQVKEGEVVSIVAKTSGAVSAPAAKLAALVEKTGKPVEVGNSVAAAKVNKALLDLAGAAELKIAPVKNTDGTISIPVTAGGKTIAPENVPGGIDVEVPTEYTADEVSSVNAVKADKSEVELVWSISLGKLQVNLTVTGAIKIVQK